MKLHHRCFKIDKTNAKAMIEGYVKNGQHIRQAIWCDVQEKPFPMLITLNRSKTKFQMSLLGEKLNPELFSISYKFVATLDTEYFIRNDMNLWKTVCSNGLFDIWEPIAPYTRFQKAESDPLKFRICLLRVYEIFEQFDPSQIVPQSDRIDHLVVDNKTVTFKEAVVEENEFKRIKSLLEQSVQEYLVRTRKH